MTARLPPAIREMMAERPRRIHHFLWHQVRNGWLRYPEESRTALRDLGWAPPRPARGSKGELLLDNDSGEDFLHMHRQMIAQVDNRLSEIGDPSYPRVEGWPDVPCPGNANYPVPPAWNTGNANFDGFLQRVKSDRFYHETFTTWQAYYRDPVTLRNLTLGQLGSMLEFTIHNYMHMRWAAEPSGIRSNPQPGHHETIPTMWDAVDYDYLGDTYSSHVNPLFWKLHGWVDSRIDDWARTNGIDEITWHGTWIGDMPGHASPSRVFSLAESRGHHDHLAKMEAAVGVIAACGVFHEFYDDASHDFFA